MNSAGKDMNAAKSSDQLYVKLRVLAATDPRAARAFVNKLLDGNHPQLESLLRHIAAPGQGRVRQIVANTVSSRDDKDRVVPHLKQWAETETDEFTREAIAAALAGVDITRYRADVPEELPDLVGTYRYVAERLCHRVRNALPSVAMRLRQMTTLLKNVSDDGIRAELMTVMTQLDDSCRRVARLVEFDIDDKYFEMRSVCLHDWLQEMNAEYSTVYEPIRLTVDETPPRSNLAISANDQLLETIFWNLWVNAVDEAHASVSADGPCEISVELSRAADGRVEILMLDNGPGIPERFADTAFKVAFSSKGVGHGRGLLEVQDAVRRLGGRISLASPRSGEYRIRLSFPGENT